MDTYINQKLFRIPFNDVEKLKQRIEKDKQAKSKAAPNPTVASSGDAVAKPTSNKKEV